MAIDLFLGMFIGGAISLIFFIFVVGIIWFVRLMLDKDLKYLLKVINYTGGQPTIEEYKAKKVFNKMIGECYFVPALKKQKRQYFVYLGTKYEYPTKKNKFVVIFVDRDGDRVPIEFNPTVVESRELILNYLQLTSEEIGSLSPKDREYVDKIHDRSKAFVKIIRKVKIDVLNPVPKNIRKFIIDNDRQIAQENPGDLGFWEKYGKDIMTISFIAVVGGVLIFLTIFAYQHADKVLASAQSAPAWAQSLINATQQNISIGPRLG
jgi:hypothetical protein